MKLQKSQKFGCLSVTYSYAQEFLRSKYIKIHAIENWELGFVEFYSCSMFMGDYWRLTPYRISGNYHRPPLWILLGQNLCFCSASALHSLDDSTDSAKKTHRDRKKENGPRKNTSTTVPILCLQASYASWKKYYHYIFNLGK